MTLLHPQFIKKDDKCDYVILSFEEFKKVQEALEDYEDLVDLREAKKDSDGARFSLESMKKELGLK